MRSICQYIFFILMLIPAIFFNSRFDTLSYVYVAFLLLALGLKKFPVFNALFYLLLAVNLLILSYFAAGMFENIGWEILNVKGEDIWVVIWVGIVIFWILFATLGKAYFRKYRSAKLEKYYLIVMALVVIIMQVFYINDIVIPNRML